MRPESSLETRSTTSLSVHLNMTRLGLLLGGLLLILLTVEVGHLQAQDDATAAPTQPGSVLAWVADGEQAGTQRADAPGSLVWMTPDGIESTLLDLPQRTARVVPCGDHATAPDGEAFAFFVGSENTGDLHLVRDGDRVTVAEGINAMACVGLGTFQFSPDGERLGYLDYSSDYRDRLSPTGRLVIHPGDGDDALASFDNASAFFLADDELYFTAFFTGNRDQAVEVAINVWDGDQVMEIATIFADEAENDCFYNSASLAPLDEDRIAALLGYRCNRGPVRETQWQLYLVNRQNRSATLAADGTTIGRFFPFTRTNAVFSAPETGTLYFTVPDGLNNRSVSVKALDLATQTVRDVIDQYALMVGLSNLPYQPDAHAPLRSPDGRWLALVTSDPNSDAALNLIDMAAPDLPPITLSAGSRGDTISEMVFSGDSSTLYYVAGGTDGSDNSLFALDLASATVTRLTRGNFGQGVLSPDGGTLALIDWQRFADDQPPLQRVIGYDISAGSSSVWVEGGAVVNAQLTEPRFAYPLAWLTAP